MKWGACCFYVPWNEAEAVLCQAVCFKPILDQSRRIAKGRTEVLHPSAHVVTGDKTTWHPRAPGMVKVESLIHLQVFPECTYVCGEALSQTGHS